MAEKLIVIGGGEHARVVVDAARLQPDKWEVIGFLDPAQCDETARMAGIKRLGDDGDIKKIAEKFPSVKFINAIGTSKTGLRRKVVEELGIPPQSWATLIHPSAVVSKTARIAEGTVVLGRAVVNPNSVTGRHCIINTGAIVEHDVKVGDFTHVSPGVITGGGCRIGADTLIGLGSRIRDHIVIGDGVTVGTGSVVVTDIPDGETVVGVPARRISTYDKGGIDINQMCVNPGTTLYEALTVIGKFGTMIAFVTDPTRKLLGVVTDGDVRRALLECKDLNCPVEKVMNRKFSYVKPEVPRVAALDKMKAMVIRQLPVLDDEGRLVGLHLLSEIIGSVSLPNVAVIMAGGKGERLRPITENIPKPMVKVAGRPILEHIILHLAGSNIREIYIAVNYLGEMIEDYFKDGSTYGCRIKYIKEEKPLGTGGALKLLKEIPREPIIVMNGDLITQFDVERMLHHHHQGGYKITVGVHDYRITIPYGVLELSEDLVSGIHEKPSRHFLVNGGVYVVDPSLIEMIPGNQPFLMTELISRCIERKDRVGVHLVEGDWIDIGQHSELASARGMQ